MFLIGVSLCLCFKKSRSAKPLYDNKFDLHETEPAGRMSFQRLSASFYVVQPSLLAAATESLRTIIFLFAQVEGKGGGGG